MIAAERVKLGWESQEIHLLCPRGGGGGCRIRESEARKPRGNLWGVPSRVYSQFAHIELLIPLSQLPNI